MIRCILYDVGQALLGYQYMVPRMRLGRLSGKSAEKVAELLHTKNNSGKTPIDLIDEGAVISRTEFAALMRITTGIDALIPDEHINKCFELCFTLERQIRTLLWYLKDHLVQGIISNTNVVQWPHILTFPTLKLREDGGTMDFHAASYQERIVKPSLEIFEIALERAREVHLRRFGEMLSPTQCIFIDDAPENVAAARSLGIHGHPTVGGEYSHIANILEWYGVPLPPDDFIPSIFINKTKFAH